MWIRLPGSRVDALPRSGRKQECCEVQGSLHVGMCMSSLVLAESYVPPPKILLLRLKIAKDLEEKKGKKSQTNFDHHSHL